MNVVADSILARAGRVLVLAYGGVALLQWFHTAVMGGDAGELPSYAHWLRDGTLALPFVLAALLLAGARSRGVQAGSLQSTTISIYFALVMGAGSLLHQWFPEDPHALHEAGTDGPQGFVVLQHTAIIMVVAALYALLVNGLFDALKGAPARTSAEAGGGAVPRLGRALARSRWARLATVLVVAVAAIPAYMSATGERAIAQTSFPDQVIHPRGSLLLIAKSLPDGSMAYVAPDYGANGVRPTIEMAEGETLNITLKNELNANVSLHVHGVHYNQDSDGTRHSNSFVRPGQQRVYQWRADPGTAGYWHYHDHVMGDDEGSMGILNGLYGGLIVRRPGDPRPAKTFVIVGHDRTINGRVYPDTPTYTARQGELVEWIIISHGNRVHTFHLHGHHWITPTRGADPNPALPANAGSGHEDNHILAPGDSFGFLVIAGDGVGPGMWMYHCHFQDHAAAMKGFFQVLPPGPSARETNKSRFFPETGKTLSGRFLEYWEQNGGLAQQGYPISEPFMEKSDLDGKTYQVQYFERAVFELHPENKPPYDVLLSQLGTFRYREKYPSGR